MARYQKIVQTTCIIDIGSRPSNNVRQVVEASVQTIYLWNDARTYSTRDTEANFRRLTRRDHPYIIYLGLILLSRAFPIRIIDSSRLIARPVGRFIFRLGRSRSPRNLDAPRQSETVVKDARILSVKRYRLGLAVIVKIPLGISQWIFNVDASRLWFRRKRLLRCNLATLFIHLSDALMHFYL